MTSVLDRPTAPFGAAASLVCRECGASYDLGPGNACEQCFGPLEIGYDSSLLSLVTRGGSNNGPTLNIYPGVIGRGAWSPGVWAQQNRGGGVRFGISSRLGVGLSTFAGIR